MHLKRMCFVGLLVLGFWTSGASARLPVHPGSDVQHQRSVLRYMAAGCFHVAPRQFICPMPAPKH